MILLASIIRHRLIICVFQGEIYSNPCNDLQAKEKSGLGVYSSIKLEYLTCLNMVIKVIQSIWIDH